MADRTADSSGRPTRIPGFYKRSGADADEDLLQCIECNHIFPTPKQGAMGAEESLVPLRAGGLLKCSGCGLPSRIPVRPSLPGGDASP